MERWDKSIRQDNRHRHRRDNPSFSSTLLDAIYRSIDDGNDAAGGGGGEVNSVSAGGAVIFYGETMRKKQSSCSGAKEEEKMANFRRACMIEKWMEKKVSEKVVVRRSSAAEFDRKSRHSREIALLNSSSSSSDSSSGGGLSSSESESLQRPKPIRTSVSAPAKIATASEKAQFDGGYCRSQYINSAPIKHQKPSKRESGFGKTKSKALKIYGDLKKVKQPISPGGRLASFLNSLFTAGTGKKAKIVDDLSNPQRKSKSANASTTTCSSASSFSRSCLSNTPSSRGKFSDNSTTKRSVRFCPVSEIVDEDCRPCGHKSLHEDREPALMAITTVRDSIDDRRRVQDMAIDLLKNYQKKNANDNRNSAVVDEFDMTDVVRRDDNAFDRDDNEDEDDDDNDDDAASYSSSDLFELDNLSAIGIERYREELPVYETTHFDTNRAIANGLIL